MSLFTRRKHGEFHDASQREEPAEAARRPATIGEQLRAKREHYGASIEQIGASLRIRPAFLEAIEENRYDRLPGTAYALGFVRSYAEHLGLDGEAMARRFKTEVAGFEPKRDLAFPVPLTERSLPGGGVLVVALILAACAYAVWYYRASGEHSRPERVAEVPPQVIPLPPSAANSDNAAPAASVPPAASGEAVAPGEGQVAPTSSPAEATPQASAPIAPPAPAAAPSASAPGTVAAQGTLAQGTVAPATTPPGAGTPFAAAPPSSPPAASGQGEATQTAAIPEPPPAAPAAGGARVFGATSGPVRIILKATSDSWIQVREPNQSVLSMRILRAGETYRVPDKPGLTLLTGNAGGLDVTVDGHSVAPIGPLGKRRTVALDPERLVAGRAGAE